MKSLFTIVKFTAKEYIKKKSFIVVNAIMILIIVALCNVPNLIKTFGSEDDEKLKVQVIDNENILNASSEMFNEIGLDYDIEYFNNNWRCFYVCHYQWSYHNNGGRRAASWDHAHR